VALPVLAKTWLYAVNQSIAPQGSALATMRRVLRTLVDSMLGFATSPWAVQGSSDSVTAGMDAVNRWVADANLVWSGGSRSWIVLRQTGIGATFEVCFDLSSGSSQIMTAVVSWVGFSGGSTSARPTAADELIVANNAQWCSGSDVAHVIHAMQADDGSSTRVHVVSQSTLQVSFLLFDLPMDPITGWSTPGVCVVRGATSGTIGTLTNFNSSAFSVGRHSGTMNLHWTAEAAGGSVLPSTGSIGNVANEISSEWAVSPIGVVCLASPRRGRHGRLADIWWAEEGVAHGDTYPNDASRQFVTFGGMVFPWNGSVPVLA
jgi:hypothetical protein